MSYATFGLEILSGMALRPFIVVSRPGTTKS